jgi:hypothetical protein
MNNDYIPDRIGRIDGDLNNDKIDNLYDMAFGLPIMSALAVPKCRYYKLLTDYPNISDAAVEVMRKPLPDHVRDDVLGFFRSHSIFVPIGDVVVDKATGVVKLRRFVIERMVEDGDLCYDGSCFKLT